MSRNQNPPVLSIAAAVAITIFFCQGGRDLPAQPKPAEKDVSRYQIAAWGYPNRNETDTVRGVYIVDTITGQIWHKENQFPIRSLGAVNPR